MNFGMNTRDLGSNTGVIDLKGEVDAFTAPKLRQEMISCVERGMNRLAVNLADVSYLDSTGLGVLIGALRRSRENNGDLVLICPNVRITRIFEITGLARIFDMFKTEEEALGRLQGKARP